MGIFQDAANAFKAHSVEAREAFGIYRSYCGGKVPPRVPGMDTYDRLAYRISLGRTVEEAAAREYLYRWSLAIKAPDQCIGAATRNACVSVFGTPHTIGM
jgi:hypothetical protein